MKISIWQQFSSNHSAYYTVVGEFTTPSQAEAAGSQIRQFFNDINAWFEKPENAQSKYERQDEGLPTLSDPERKITEQYAIQWYENGVDWVFPGVEGVFVVDRLLFIEPPDT
jgi:hypothetical protein